MAIAIGVGGDRSMAAAPDTQTKVRRPAATALSIVVGFAFVTAAYVVVLLMHRSGHSTYRIDSQWSAFAGLFVLALAIERALAPFSQYLGPNTTKLEHERNEALAAGRAIETASAQADLQRARHLTAIVAWGAATALAFLLCGALNVTLLEAIRADGSGQPPFWADLLVTGFVVGSGTKPLHDLVTNLQKNKDNKNDPVQVGGLGKPWV